MKAIIINSVCKFSSTGALAYGFYQYLTNLGHETLVCYGRGDNYLEENLVKIDTNLEIKIHASLTRLTGLQGFFSKKATMRLKDIIENFEPDVVYLLNLHGYYINEKKLFEILRDMELPVVYIMPDEYPFLGKCCFSGDCEKYKEICTNCPDIRGYPRSLFFDRSKKIYKLKEKSYEELKKLVFLSVPYNCKKAKESKLLANKKIYQHNWGIDLKNLYYPASEKEIYEVKQKYSIPIEKRIVLTVASFKNNRKGVREYFFQCANEIKLKDLVFINVGFDGDVSICPDNFIPISYITDQKELSILYSIADVFVTTSLEDTMPLAALIALGCGTPICGFNQSGIPYLKIDDYDNCVELIEPNLCELIKVISNIEKKTFERINECRKYALKNFNDENFYKYAYEIGESLYRNEEKYED